MKNSSASEKDTKFDDDFVEAFDEKTRLTPESASTEEKEGAEQQQQADQNETDKDMLGPTAEHSKEMDHIFNQFNNTNDNNDSNFTPTTTTEALSTEQPPQQRNSMNDTQPVQQQQQQEHDQQAIPFIFDRFLDQMKAKSSKPITRYFKSFLQAFERRPWTVNEQIKIIQDFLDFIYVKMRECDVWKDMSEQEFDNAKEGMEKLVMNRLYHATFSPSTTDDKERDEILYQKISIFRWIREKHLDIPETEHNESFLTFAESELLKINNYKAPRDKLICILNCCKVIFGLIKHVEEDAGADKFLPILIYVILRANPPRLVSNMQYIYRFRNPEQLQAEAGYYLTNMMGAISFIETMDASSLSISQAEFDKNIELTMTELKQERPSVTLDKQQINYENALHPIRSSAARQRQQHHLHAPPPLIDATKAAALIEKGSQFAQKTMQRPLNFVGKIFQGLSDTSNNNSRAGSPEQEDEQNFTRQQQYHPLPQPYYPSHPPYTLSPSLSPPPLPMRDTHQQQFTSAQAQAQPSSQTNQQPPSLPPRPSPEELIRERQQQFDSNLEILNSMFTNIDQSVCHLVLHANGGDLTKSIDNLLEMSGNEQLSLHDNTIHEPLPTTTTSSFSSVQTSAPIVPPKNT